MAKSKKTNPILVWLAKSPLSTGVRIGIGAALVYIIDNVGAFNLDPATQVALVAAVSTALRWVNPEDKNYGKK